MARSPATTRLVCDSCSSGRRFACSFLQTAPRDAALAVRLAVPVTRARRGLPPPGHFPARFRSPVIQRRARRWRAVPGAPRKRAAPRDGPALYRFTRVRPGGHGAHRRGAPSDRGGDDMRVGFADAAPPPRLHGDSGSANPSNVAPHRPVGPAGEPDRRHGHGDSSGLRASDGSMRIAGGNARRRPHSGNGIRPRQGGRSADSAPEPRVRRRRETPPGWQPVGRGLIDCGKAGGLTPTPRAPRARACRRPPR